MEVFNIKGCTVEYFDDSHQYLCEGILLPSITQLIKVKFGNMYQNVSSSVLKRASERGTKIHQVIQDYCEQGIEDDCRELHNFKFLKNAYEFNVISNETPVVLFKEEKPIACGRLDLVLEKDGEIGLADIKTTSTLNREYLAYQLNLYRIAYQQNYDTEITFLRGLHLREDTRKFVVIPVNEDMAWKLVNEYMEENT